MTSTSHCPRSQKSVGHCQVPFFERSAISAASLPASYVSRKRAGDFGPFRSASSAVELPSKTPIRCSKLCCPAFEASAPRIASGTWPTNGIFCFRHSSAIAKYASRGTYDWILMKSTPRRLSICTARRPSSGLAIEIDAGNCDLGPSSIGPDTTSRGASRRPSAASSRADRIGSRSLPMSRTPVTPFARKSGSVTSRPPGTQSPKKVCTCMSQSPGIRNFPEPSITRPPSGASTPAAGPMPAMRSPSIRTVMSGRAVALAGSITVTCVRTTGAGATSAARSPSDNAQETRTRIAARALVIWARNLTPNAASRRRASGWGSLRAQHLERARRRRAARGEPGRESRRETQEEDRERVARGIARRDAEELRPQEPRGQERRRDSEEQAGRGRRAFPRARRARAPGVGSAPSAIRTPNSRRRCATEYATTP